MQLSFSTKAMVNAAVVILLLSACQDSRQDPVLARVVIVRGGDTALDGKFARAVEASIRETRSLQIATAASGYDIAVVFDQNVRTSQQEGIVQVIYNGSLRSARGIVLGSLSGSCREQFLSQCAEEIAQKVRGVALELTASE